MLLGQEQIREHSHPIIRPINPQPLHHHPPQPPPDPHKPRPHKIILPHRMPRRIRLRSPDKKEHLLFVTPVVS